MKKFTLPQFLFFISLILIPFVSKSQVSVTANDFISVLVTGNTYVTYMDTTTQQVDVGTSGENHWDLSDLVVSSDFETESKLVTSSPFSDEFPDADYASNYSGIFSGVQSNSWVYNSIDTDFITHGTATVANTSVGDIETLIKYDPAWVQYSLPIQFGDSVGYTGTQTVETTTTIPGIGETNNTIEQAITVTQKVDGYGTVTYPGGDQYRMLRIVEETTFNYDGFISSYTIVRLISKTGESVTFTPADSSSYNGVINVENVSWTSGSGSGVVEVDIDSPTSLAATEGDGQIDISWSDNSDNETGFYIERADDGGAFVLIDSTSADVSTYSDIDVEAGVEYTYRIQAYNEEGTSDFSSEVSAMIEAEVTVDAPSGLSATAGETSIEITWTDNADNETGFYIERAEDGGGFMVIDSTSADVSTYTDSEVEAGIEYTYRIQAYNNEEMSDFSSEVSAMIEVVVTVDAPSGLSATAGETSIEITWTDNADNETGFYIERAEDGGSFMVIDSTSADVSTYTDTDVEAEVEYSYRIQAYSNEVKSDYSAVVSATIVASGLEHLQNVSSQVTLEQNFPNPFTSATTIRFNLPESDHVKLVVYNSDGKVVKQIFDTRLANGEHSVDFTTNELESGIYFYRLETKNFSETKNMVLLK